MLLEELKVLKEQKQAIILAHYYVDAAIQEAADFVGDSFALAKKAKETDAKIIVFAGVRFMAESAKILNPDKKVLVPDLDADCPMAHMAMISRVKQMRENIEDLAVVCYVNSTAELKQVSDVCVTSSNAVKICQALPQKNIFFVPDQNLGRFVASQVKDKTIYLNDGYCPIHHQTTSAQAKQMKEKHPSALLLVHPECPKEVVDLADYAGSTAGIIAYAKNSDAKEFIIGTEIGVLYELQKQCPDKIFYEMSASLVCKDMKLLTMEKLIQCLQEERNEIVVDETLAQAALRSLDAMLEMAS